MTEQDKTKQQKSKKAASQKNGGEKEQVKDETKEQAKSFEYKKQEDTVKEVPSEKEKTFIEQYARLQADFENYKRRNKDNAVKMYQEGVADVIADILPTLDYLEMAIESQKEDSFRQGMELVKKAFLDALSKYGVKEIEALGKEFDPNIHEAVMNKDDPENAGKVVQVLKKGYSHNDKVLRHPLVVVAQ